MAIVIKQIFNTEEEVRSAIRTGEGVAVYQSGDKLVAWGEAHDRKRYGTLL